MGVQIPFVPKSAAEEFRQSIRIDIGGLEMRAHEGKGARFEAARQFCTLQYSLVALTTASAEDKLAALNEIDAAVNKLDALFPGVFTAAKDLVVSAREALSVCDEIEDMKRQFESSDLEHATWLLKGRSASLAFEVNRGPFRDQLREALSDCWTEVKATHPDERVRDLLGKQLSNHRPSGRTGSSSSNSNSSLRAGEIASLRAADATKVTLPPLRVHVAPPSRHLRTNALNIGPTVANLVALTDETDKLLKDLSALGASDLGHRLLLGEVADLIDKIMRGGHALDIVLATLEHGLGGLRLTHKDPEMRAEIDRVLGYCFDQRGDKHAFMGERRLEMRVEFLLREAPGMAASLNKCRDDFAHKLVDDIRRETGEESRLMLHLLCEVDHWPGLDQLKEAIYQQASDGSE